MIGTPKALFQTSTAGALPQTEFELYFIDQQRLLTDYDTVYIDYVGYIDESRFQSFLFICYATH